MPEFDWKLVIAHVFAFGLWFVGSVAVELLDLLKALHKNPKKVPARFKSRLYLLVRLAWAIVAGIVASCARHESYPPWFYLAVGAAAPAIITRLLATVPDPDEDPSPRAS
jgi:hypothetical protein